jgi:hypothetical protein
MPRATITTATQEFELKSCEGGTVELKRLTYGQTLARRDMVMAFTFGAPTSKGGDPDAGVELQNLKVTQFEWSNSIVNWNLTDENDQPLDWKKSNLFEVIDPAIAEEISQLITGMNDFEAELKN